MDVLSLRRKSENISIDVVDATLKNIFSSNDGLKKNILFIGAPSDWSFYDRIIYNARRMNQPLQQPTYTVSVIDYLQEFISPLQNKYWRYPGVKFYFGTPTGGDEFISAEQIHEYYRDKNNGKGENALAYSDAIDARVNEIRMASRFVGNGDNAIETAYSESNNGDFDVIIFNSFWFGGLKSIASRMENAQHYVVFNSNTIAGYVVDDALGLSERFKESKKYLTGSETGDNSYNGNRGIAYYTNIPK
jgi:hypothetical protein